MVRRAASRGTANGLMDLGLPDAEELAAKLILAKEINDILESRALTQRRRNCWVSRNRRFPRSRIT